MLSDVRTRIGDYNLHRDFFFSAAGYSDSARTCAADPQPLRGGHTSRSVGISACWTDFRPTRSAQWLSETAYRADLHRLDILMNNYLLHDLAPVETLSDTVSSDSDVSDDTDWRPGHRPCGPWDADSDYYYDSDADYGL